MNARGAEKSSSWPANIVLTIVLALLAGQQAWNSFNSNTAKAIADAATDIAVLKEQMRGAMASRCTR